MQDTKVVWLGHSTVLIEALGTRLLTDPILRTRVAHLRRLGPPVPEVGEIDAVLMSHAHHDHLDRPSLVRVGKNVPIFAPPGVGRVLRRRGLTVNEVQPGESFSVNGLEIRAVEAEHDGRRYPFWPGQTTLAFVVEAPSRIFFAGDTDVFEGMGALGGDLELALLPIWGWGKRVGPGHMNPERAAQAAALLRPRLLVPIHWGTLASPRAPWRSDPHAPARALHDEVSRLAPGVEVRVLVPGDQLCL